ncbi:F-box only protein 46 [Alligator mississippiensis]|uniref:F-box only protein 46 n=1 Tax=Alligator mississippiensis TaxID=8496 RepID=A0A151NK73_ALLMI|nr:F-box only protein 46 [Alligator mississippiensis]
MDPGAFPHIQLWCPRPFGTYSQNKPCQAAPARRPFCRAKEDGAEAESCSENTPPAPAPAPPPGSPGAGPVEEGRVLLDTWYVIKPGNTKEKIAFFVAHQCSSSRASTMKVKGHWGSDSSKAKRRRRSHDPSKAKATEATCPEPPPPPPPPEPGTADTDLLSVAEMVALAVARLESRERERQNGCGPGEVRIAFRISSTRDPRAAPDQGAGARPSCMFVGCSAPAARAKDKITCDLYQLISPSRDALPTNVDFLLAAAAASPKAEGPPEAPSGDAGGREAPVGPGKAELGVGEKSVGRDCMAGFHVDVVVTGVVDECVFFGKDSTKNMKEETVCLVAGPEALGEDPPPGQLFFLHSPEDTRAPDVGGTDGAPERGSGAGAPDSAPPGDPSLCRLYRHVSHDFLEIRFKIQRLLEPRQYMLLLPEHVMVKIFAYLPTRSLAALKCSCHYFKSLIETFGIQATDSRWTRDPLYRDDPCKQCRKRYEKGDVSLCRWHPKPYHHDLPYGRSYWMCCRRPDKEAPGCRVGLHDNHWVQPCLARDRDRDRGGGHREDAR